MTEQRKIYSVGKGSLWAWTDSAEEAARIRREDGKTRLGIYQWDVNDRPDGTVLVSNPRRLSPA